MLKWLESNSSLNQAFFYSMANNIYFISYKISVVKKYDEAWPGFYRITCHGHGRGHGHEIIWNSGHGSGNGHDIFENSRTRTWRGQSVDTLVYRTLAMDCLSKTSFIFLSRLFFTCRIYVYGITFQRFTFANIIKLFSYGHTVKSLTHHSMTQPKLKILSPCLGLLWWHKFSLCYKKSNYNFLPKI